jgi:HK97 family phage major capsid protein
LQAARLLPLNLPVWAKAGVAPGTTADSTYAAPLVPFQTYAAEYVEYLRPQTILGRIPGVRKIPFNVHMPRAIGGTSAGWVGETVPKPLSKMSFDNIYLGFAKISAICALSNELVMFSSPAAEEVVSRDLGAAIIGFQDSSFIDHTISAVPDVSPAAITYGITPITSSGSTAVEIISDVAKMFAAGIAGNVHFDNGCWVMHPRTANYLGSLLTTGGQRLWPEINIRGGMWYGLPVITSASVPVESGGETTLTLIDGGEVFLADDSGVTLSASNEAALQMLTNPATGATTQISLWQANLSGIKVERWENWARRHDAGVQILESVSF